MSFFGEMVAGAVGGAGAGLVQWDQQQEREKVMQAQQEEKRQLALQLQQQRSEDMRYRVDQDAQNKADRLALVGGGSSSGGSRSGGASSGMNLQQMMYEADTPEKQDRLLRLIDTNAGPDAARMVAEKMFNRPMAESQKVEPTQGDFARYERGQTDSVPETHGENVNLKYDTNRGLQALNRLQVLARDSSDAKGFSEAERQYSMNDRANSATQGMKPLDAAEQYGTLSNPRLNTSKDDLQEQRIAASSANAQLRAGTTATQGELNRTARERLAAENGVSKAMGSKESILDGGASKKAAIDAAQKRLDALKSPAKAAKSTSGWSMKLKG